MMFTNFLTNKLFPIIITIGIITTILIMSVADLYKNHNPKKIFGKLYNTIDGKKISWDARNKLPKEETEHIIYGEIEWQSIKEVLTHSFVRKHIANYKHFCDLGSGSGRIVVEATGLLESLESFTGVEILKELYETSEQVLERYKKLYPKGAEKINYINANFFDVDLSGYDIIFMHFPMTDAEELYLKLEEKMKNELKSGSMIISIIRSLRDEETFPKLGEITIKTDYFDGTHVNYHLRK